MPATNFPNGLTAFGVPTMGVNGVPATSGNIWYVSSVTGSVAFTGTLSQPFATITQGQTAASAGDVVVLMSGHAETISAAAGIALSKAGVTYVGIGVGAARPTFTFGTATTATLTITGANISLTNIVSVIAFNQVVSPFVVSAANVTLGVTCQDGSAILEAVRDVLTTAAADNFTLNLVHQGFTAGSSGVNAVRLVGGRNATLSVNYYGKASTAIVEFLTTAVVDAQISGVFYNSGTTDLSKNVVDTVTASTWSVQGFDATASISFDGGSGGAIAGNDVATVIADLAVPSADATTNVYERDVIGNKTDASVYAPATTKSVLSYVKGNADLQENVVVSATAVIVNGNTLFTVAGGPIEILSLLSICQTSNNATASTLQYSSSGTLGATTQTISGATASLASATAGTSVTWQGTALSTAPLVNANSANIIATNGGIIVPAGTLTAVVAVGSTTGTWNHFLRYRPLAKGVTVS